MSLRSAQLWIAATFLTGLLCNAAAVLITYARGAIFADNLRTILATLLAVYSGPLAIVIAGFFGKEGPEPKPVASNFWVAIVVSVVWNVFLLWGGIGLLASSMSSQPNENAIDDFSSYIGTISSSATFLVSGALTFFFVRHSAGGA
jgi:hypothetical protein